MRFCNGNKSRTEMGVYNDERVRREFEKAITDGHICGIPFKKGKRFRSAFTTEQVKYLEKEFRKYPYIGNSRRKDVSNVLDIPERAVKIWFQNRRMKEKKDTSNKEADGCKSVVVNGVKQSFNTICTLQASNDGSLPLITTTISPPIAEMKENTSSDPIHANKNCFKDLSSRDVTVSSSKKDSASTIQSNITSIEVTLSPPMQYKIEKDDEASTVNLSDDYIPNNNHVRQTPPVNHVQYPGEIQYQYTNYFLPSSSAVPQDLSSKSAARPQQTQSSSSTTYINPQEGQSEHKNIEVKLSPTDVPFYLKAFYAQPYLPPGNMIWKPVNVAPIMTSAPLQPLTISNPGSATLPPNIMKRNCSCDCHKPYVNPMMLQNNLGPNVQYVITAVPMQNSSPKF